MDGAGAVRARQGLCPACGGGFVRVGPVPPFVRVRCAGCGNTLLLSPATADQVAPAEVAHGEEC